MKERNTIPFQFDLRSILERARKIPKMVDGISISLPFINISIKPENIERDIAREITIRMADKRVLNAFECCDKCIDNALKSLQEIRSLLVDKQVELKNETDCILYLLIELMLEAIRQFFTFTERKGPFEFREEYFSALEMLRAHLFRCLSRVSDMAEIKIPKISTHMRYDMIWDERAYKSLNKR